MASKLNTSIDVDALSKLISGESSFISSVMNKITPLSWEGDSGSSEEVDSDEDVDGVILKNGVVKEHNASPSQSHEVAQSSHKGKQKVGSKHMLKKTFENKHDRMKKEKEDQKVYKQAKPPEQTKPGFSSEGKMVFSKFDFSEMGSYVEEKKKKVCNDPRRILEKLKERHELLQKLKKEGNEEKALKLKEKDGWNKAFSKVQGIKVRDDPEMLKETIYKQDLRKTKHKKLWETREEKVKKAIEYKVIKRETNIKAKRDLKLKHRLKKALKKGRIIPGFS